jgi:hypothetical protein
MPWNGQISDFQELPDFMAGNNSSDIGHAGFARFRKQIRRLAGSGPFDDGADFTIAQRQSSGGRS